MIDLHSHTTESDGTYTPKQLVDAAVALRLDALAITDHDTFAGYNQARQLAAEAGLKLVCGIEMSTKIYHPVRRTVHLLGYFGENGPSSDFISWIEDMQEARRDRNSRLAERLQSLGLDIRLEEVNALGRSLAGRPHFAKLMVSKGYVPNITEAFRLYLDESAPGYVERQEPSLAEAIQRINQSGGISSLAHPVRLGKTDPLEEEELVAEIVRLGLQAIEAYHSDHSREDTRRYLGYAEKYGLRITGGSDFHGDNKPKVKLGCAQVPTSILDELRQ